MLKSMMMLQDHSWIGMLLKRQDVTIRPKVEWYSQAVDRARREKRKCERKWRATKLAVHKEIFREAYDQLSKIIIASIIQPLSTIGFLC